MSGGLTSESLDSEGGMVVLLYQLSKESSSSLGFVLDEHDAMGACSKGRDAGEYMLSRKFSESELC